MRLHDPIKDVYQTFNDMTQEDTDASLTASYFFLRGIDRIKTTLVGWALKDNEEHGIKDEVILKEYKDLLIAYMQCCTECHKNDLKLKKYWDTKEDG